MNLAKREIKELFETILALQSLTEANAFFRDLLTESEILEFSMRFRAANMLAQNIPYVQIQKQTGLSSTTVARISKWLTSGKDGYKQMIARNSHMHPSRKKVLI